MFTGIVQTKASVVSVSKSGEIMRLVLSTPNAYLNHLDIGARIFFITNFLRQEIVGGHPGPEHAQRDETSQQNSKHTKQAGWHGKTGMTG